MLRLILVAFKKFIRNAVTVARWSLVAFVVLVVCLLASAYVAHVISEDLKWPRRVVSPWKEFLVLVDQHWKAALILFVPVFYREVASVIRRFKKAFGVETFPPEEQKQNPVEEPQGPQERDAVE